MFAFRTLFFTGAYFAGTLAMQYCACENSSAAVRYVGIQDACSELSSDWCTSDCDEFGDNCDVCKLTGDGDANAEDTDKLQAWCDEQEGFNADTEATFTGGVIQCYESEQEWMDETECFACTDCRNDKLARRTLMTRALEPVQPPEYEKYITGSDNLVSSQLEELLYEQGNYALYKVTEVHSLGYEWSSQYGNYNGKSKSLTVQKTVKLGFSSKSGTETTNSITASLGAAAEGVSFSLEAKTETRIFNTEERSSESTTTETFEAEAKSYTAYYQQQLKFETQVWYKLDIRGQYRTVGSPNRDEVALKTFGSTVKLNNFALLDGKLTGETPIGVKTVKSTQDKNNLIPWRDIPGRVKDILRNQGV
ncbi:hypothetical protein FSPOR_8940 [Fusarium sporotrichioides]|uniref:MACPF domain-containing protein n=1 Tax=Fusarium sporotrichioides TaxID=5514 RepID=A0A395RS27_FUSSP|nr:hypothetical protein FSPOR_8940 [Fusarium sporotrichioides]